MKRVKKAHTFFKTSLYLMLYIQLSIDHQIIQETDETQIK